MSSVKQMLPSMSFFIALFFPLTLILAGVAMLYFGGRSIHLAKESVSWPEANGQIQSASLEHSYSGGARVGVSSHAVILYTFTVGGHKYRGNKVAFGEYESSDPSHALQIVNRYPKDKPVSVRYMPTDPDVCVLEPGIQGEVWVLPVFGLVLLLAGTFILPWAMRIQRASKHQPLVSEKRFTITYKGTLAGRYTRDEILLLIKHGVISFDTPLWDERTAKRMCGAWEPAWRALGFPAKANRSLLPLEPADDLSQYFSPSHRSRK
ncbi:MAG: DUF3592 domain-containing protein [bacterium]